MISKPKHTQTRRIATTRHRPWRSRCARIKQQLLGKWPRGLPHLRELLLFCACVRAGANLRPNHETTSGEEIPCPDLSLRSGRNTSFRWIFRSWKLSEPTFVSTCSVHRSYCRRILYRSRSIYGLHRGTINSDLRSNIFRKKNQQPNKRTNKRRPDVCMGT